MKNLAYKIRLMMLGVFISMTAVSVAQVGGGSGISAPPLPDDPTFTSLTVADDVDASLTLLIDNDSTGTIATARVAISADNSNGALFVAAANRSTAIVTGGPTGAQVLLRGLGNYPLVFGTSNTARMQIDGAGVVTIAGAVVATLTDLQDLAITDSGTFTPVWTGFSVNPTQNIGYTATGDIACLDMGGATNIGTSNNTSFSLTGIPVAARPQTSARRARCRLTDNGSRVDGMCNVSTAGGITFGVNFITSASGGADFTASGNKGLGGSGWSVCYSIR